MGLAAATGPASSRAAAHAAAKGTVTIAITGDPGKLDPGLTSGAEALQVAEFSYDTLVHQLPGGKIVSGLATKWKVLSQTRVRFTLRSGVTCSDGTKMTASVVKKNLDFIANAANGSQLIIYVPVGTKTAANNKKRTVTVTFPSANPFPVQGIGAVHMVCSKGLANRSSLVNGADGSGPYRMVSANPGSKYTFALRKGYTWGPNGVTSKGMPAKVVLDVVTNETTAANELLTGEVNIATVTGPDRSRLEKAKLFKRVVAAQPGELWFNEKKGHPTASVTVRKGIIQALQVGQLGKVFTSGDGSPMKQLTLPSFTPCFGNSVKGSVPKHNIAKAQQALSGQPSLKLLYQTDGGPGSPAAMTLAQQELSAAGDNNATLDGVTGANLLGVIFGGGDWDVALVPLGVSAPAQLVPFLSGPTPAGGGDNFANIHNIAYLNQTAAAVKASGAKSCTHWLAAEKAIFSHGDLLPTWWASLPTFAKGAKFTLGDQGVAPTSLRLTKKK
ncbi:MAG TPA: ABC transporter substrate-binding protein [Gaiellaceae bacterium]|nr:ABC transporter substrate-binding protein [Gaiellaceae bacterium]